MHDGVGGMQPCKNRGQVHQHHGGQCGARQCDNCETTETPLWRPERSLGMMLCNACSIWWRTKKTHRPKPSPEVLQKRAAAAAAKAKTLAALAASQETTPESSPDGSLKLGKRVRRTRSWGEDMEVYDESSPEQDFERYPTRAIRFKSGFEVREPVEPTPEAALMAARALASFKHPELLPERPESAGPSRPACSKARQPSRRAATERHGDARVTVSYSRKPRAGGSKGKTCLNCATTETPTWRRAGGQFPLCNACGVYFTTHGVHRVPPCSVPLQATTRPKAARSASELDSSPPTSEHAPGATRDKKRRRTSSSAETTFAPPAARQPAAPPAWPAAGASLPPPPPAAKLGAPPPLFMEATPLRARAAPPPPLAKGSPADSATSGVCRSLFGGASAKPSIRVVNINVSAFSGAFHG